ncbi:MAG: ABC transporter ATP-binding protein [Clostridia bacterium]|nr:ABC transporter ATP-binding protein [Clostridia bacterium]
MNAIEIRGLCRAYNGRKAVDGLTLSIGKGELFSLLGVNGAGKTTAIRMLTGILPPDGGDAFLMGKSIRTELEAAKRISNLSPQEPAVAPKLSVRENLEFIGEIYGLSRKEARRRAEGMIDGLGMAEVARQRAGTLSGGWQRRLSIAMALVTEPEVLFLDEPTLGLDVLARRELWQVLKGLRGRVTILMTTHYLEEAEALSDRIGILQRGRLRACGTAAELIARAGTANFEDAFVKLAGGERA